MSERPCSGMQAHLTPATRPLRPELGVLLRRLVHGGSIALIIVGHSPYIGESIDPGVGGQQGLGV